MKKLTALLLLLAISLTLLVACGKPAEPDVTARVGVLSGPTGMGLAKLISDNSAAEEKNYEFEVFSSPDTALADLAAGKLDFLCLPTNTAANLANKKDDYVTVVAINCLGSLYLVADKNESIESVADLEGKTVYTSVASSTTVPILNYILRENHVNAQVEVEKDHDTLVSRIQTGEVSLAVLPEPKVTVALTSATDYKVALNLSEEWDKVSDSPLTMGCIVVRNGFLAQYPNATKQFLRDCESSISYIGNRENLDAAAGMICDAGILPKVPVAKKALSNLYGSIVYIGGADMKNALTGFYNLLLDTMPAAIGEKLPEDSFYYLP